MGWERRRLLRTAVAGAMVGAAGCLHADAEPDDGGIIGGDGNDDEDEDEEIDDLIADVDTEHEPWATFGADPANTGHAPDASPPDGDELWSFETDGPLYGGAAVVDGRVYFGSVDDSVYAFTIEGDELWTFETEDSVRSTPLVTDDHLFVGSDDEVLYRLDRGTDEFRQTVEGTLHRTGTDGPVRAAPKRVETTNHTAVVYAVTGGSFTDGLETVGAVSTEGDELWTFEGGDTMAGAPAVGSGSVYVPRQDGILYSLDANDGGQNWQAAERTVEVSRSVHSGPAYSDGRVYLCADTGVDSGVLRSIDADGGETVWTYEADGRVRTSPAVADGTVYFGDDTGTFHAVTTDGDELWTYEADGRIRASPAVGDGFICFGSDDSHVQAVTTEGDELWSFETANSVRSPPALIDGRVFVGSLDNRMYAIE